MAKIPNLNLISQEVKDKYSITSNAFKGIGLMLLVLVCWFPAEVLGKLIYATGASPITLLQFRYIISSVLFFLTILINGKQGFRIEKNDIIRVVASSTFLALHLLLFWSGFKMVKSISTAIAVYFFYPSVVALVSRFIGKEKVAKYVLGSLLIGFIGLLFGIGILPSFNFDLAVDAGKILVFLSGLCMGGYLLFSKKISQRYSPQTICFWNSLAVSVVFLFLQKASVTLSQINGRNILYLLFLAVCSTYVAYLILVKAISFLKSPVTGIIHMSRSGLSVILAFLVFRQIPATREYIGLIFGFLSILLLTIGEGKASHGR